MARFVEGRRNKGRDKLREKKKHPYKSGGQFRSGDVKLRNAEDRPMKKKGKH